MILYIIFVK